MDDTSIANNSLTYNPLAGRDLGDDGIEWVMSSNGLKLSRCYNSLGVIRRGCLGAFSKLVKFSSDEDLSSIPIDIPMCQSCTN